MPLLRFQFLSLVTVVAAGGLAACQSTTPESAEPAHDDAVPTTTATARADSLFLGLIFPYAPSPRSGPVTKAALLMTRPGAPLEQVELGRFEGRATLLDSLAERQFPEGALLGFRAATDTAGTDVAVLRANDTTLHVLSRPMPADGSSTDTAAFHLLKKVPIAAHTYVRVVR